MGKLKNSTMGDGGRKSGRAVFDNQGRASWEWQTATGVFESNVSNEQLQRLEASDLALADHTGTASEGRVWTRDSVPHTPVIKQSSASAKNSAKSRVSQSGEYETVLRRILRRLSG
jgi:hypothetical protein